MFRGTLLLLTIKFSYFLTLRTFEISGPFSGDKHERLLVNANILWQESLRLKTWLGPFEACLFSHCMFGISPESPVNCHIKKNMYAWLIGYFKLTSVCAHGCLCAWPCGGLVIQVGMLADKVGVSERKCFSRATPDWLSEKEKALYKVHT